MLIFSIVFTAGCMSQHREAPARRCPQPASAGRFYHRLLRSLQAFSTDQAWQQGFNYRVAPAQMERPGQRLPQHPHSPQQVLTVKTWEQDTGSIYVHYGLQCSHLGSGERGEGKEL